MRDIEIVYVREPDLKAEIAAKVLFALPYWFGLPDSTREYIEQSRSLPFWAAFHGETAVGFVSMMETSKSTAEVHCMGLLLEYHRKGIGRKLMGMLEDHAKAAGYRLLQVKTVDEGHYKEYDRTIAFYEGVGFLRLEVFPTLWDEWNPCLVLVKPL